MVPKRLILQHMGTAIVAGIQTPDPVFVTGPVEVLFYIIGQSSIGRPVVSQAVGTGDIFDAAASTATALITKKSDMKHLMQECTDIIFKVSVSPIAMPVFLDRLGFLMVTTW